MRTPSRATGVADAPDRATELTDAELEAVTAGKMPTPGMEGRSGWFVPLPEKLRRNTRNT